MAYEALYRRYRPSRFQDAFFGQEHVVAALRNAIEGDRVGHAYLFSGPRGTGKTTSARILAKALNCTDLQGGEPCNVCDSCLAFQSGGSYDLHELDAASNNGVDAMRDLIGKVALGSPGRTKVYILDEVHMLSPGAENALLKTLEEPPPHVVFVLCTTEPNKVVPTIRSRTQHLEFSLLSATQVGELVDYIVSDAGLELTPEDRSYVIRAGGGSARDTLSALDQVVAAGGAPQGGEHLEALFQSLIDRDAGAALVAIDGALQAGRDAASVGTSLLHALRAVFLAAMRADVSHLPEAERELATTRAAAMSPARVTRAIEVIGTSIIEMRNAPDPRVDLEVAIMRLTRPDLDTDPAALVERLEALEHQLAGGAPIAFANADVDPVPAPPAATAPVEAAAPQTQAPQPAAAPPAQAAAPQAQVAPQAPQPAAAPPAQAAAPQAQVAPQAPQPAAAPQTQAASRPDPAASGSTPRQELPSPEHQRAPAPVAGRPAAEPPPSGGRRGADMVRAELAKQGLTAPMSEGTASARQATPPPGAQTDTEPAPSGKTLADVRRERQAAAQAAGAPQNDPSVDAAAAARRERQAAAQSGGQASPAAAPADPVPVAPATASAAESAPVASAPSETAPAATEAAAQTPAEPVPTEAAHAEAAPTDAALPGLAELDALWQPLLESMSGRVRSRFSAGHFMETSPDSVMFGLPNPVHRDRCEEIRAEVDAAFTTTFGRPIPMSLVVDMVEEEPDFFAEPPSGGAGGVSEAEAIEDVRREEDAVDVHDLVDATGDVPSAEDRVMATFENSELVEDPPNQHPNQ